MSLFHSDEEWTEKNRYFQLKKGILFSIIVETVGIFNSVIFWRRNEWTNVNNAEIIVAIKLISRFYWSKIEVFWMRTFLDALNIKFQRRNSLEKLLVLKLWYFSKVNCKNTEFSVLLSFLYFFGGISVEYPKESSFGHMSRSLHMKTATRIKTKFRKNGRTIYWFY